MRLENFSCIHVQAFKGVREGGAPCLAVLDTDKPGGGVVIVIQRPNGSLHHRQVHGAI